MPGDSYRNLQYQTNVSQNPLILCCSQSGRLRFGTTNQSRPSKFLSTGDRRVGGKVPISPVKVTIAVVIVLLIILAVHCYSWLGGRLYEQSDNSTIAAGLIAGNATLAVPHWNAEI